MATPIGNLGDLSPRAVRTLAEADVVCCEDTRRTRALLSAAGVPAPSLVALHRDNEREQVPAVLARLARGDAVAVVSDAGTPGVSDPGAVLVAAAVEAGVPVSVVPGPSAAIGALVVSGLPTDRFCFEGFLPRRGPDRRRRLEGLAGDQRTTVVYEAANRLARTLVDLAAVCGPRRPVVVVRELTKLHEEVWRGTTAAAAAAFAERAEGPGLRGEVVVVVGGAPAGSTAVADATVAEAVDRRRRAGASARDAAAAVAAELGVPRRRAYAMAVRGREAGSPVGGATGVPSDGP